MGVFRLAYFPNSGNMCLILPVRSPEDQLKNYMRLFEELKRRNVFRVSAAYLVTAWLLVQVADVVFDAAGAPNWVMQAVLVVLAIGFPVTALLAWAFELTPDGLKKDKDVNRTVSVGANTRRTLDRIIIVFLTLAVALLVIDRFTGRGEGETGSETLSLNEQPASVAPRSAISDTKSIAVLPFENRSPDPEDEFFADGMHDELLTRLFKISDLKVISRTTVMGYQDSDLKVPDIARELGVATVMEGSVQRSGKRVRINVQLVDAESDAHMWAEIYDRELSAENIFDIQSEITKAIASALNSALSASNEAELVSRPTRSLAAYDAYVAGRLLFNRLSRPGFEQAVELFDSAISEDPLFAAAYSAKAEALLELFWLYDVGDQLLVAAARDALDRAEALDPDAVETQNALAHYYYYVLQDYDLAIATWDRVLERAPNLSRAWAGKGFALRRSAQYDEAISALQQAHELDPFAIDPIDGIFETNAILGRFRPAREMLDQLKAMAPSSMNALTGEASFNFHISNPTAGWLAIDKPVDDPGWRYYQMRLETAIRTRDEAHIVKATETWPQQYRSPERFPELYNLVKAESLLTLDRMDDADELLGEIKSRLDAQVTPYPSGWLANASYFPVDLPGLMRDLPAVREVVAEYEANLPVDIYARHEQHHWVIARAYARAGDAEAALDYLEKQVEALGPARFLPMRAEPAFDTLREHPRYLALKQGYEIWSQSRN
jgi:TolB-like protein